jgi:hypothetical protein
MFPIEHFDPSTKRQRRGNTFDSDRIVRRDLAGGSDEWARRPDYCLPWGSR